MLLGPPDFLTSDLSIWFNTVCLRQAHIAPLTFPAMRRKLSARISPTPSARISNAKQSLSFSAMALTISSTPFTPCCQTVPLNPFLVSSFDVFSNFLLCLKTLHKVLLKSLFRSFNFHFRLVLPCCIGFHILLN